MRDKPPINQEYCAVSGKKCFTKKDAQTVMNSLSGNGMKVPSARTKTIKKVKRKIKRRAVRIYPCPYCNTWHVTSRKNY